MNCEAPKIQKLYLEHNRDAEPKLLRANTYATFVALTAKKPYEKKHMTNKSAALVFSFGGKGQPRIWVERKLHLHLGHECK